jgi:peroxiredoxin
MAKRRVGSPVGVALVSTVLAGLVVALVLSIVLDDGDESTSDVPGITLGGPTSIPQAGTEGDRAPDVSFPDLRTGDEQTFEEFRDGRPVLVNFFYRTCPPCIEEMPDLQAAYDQYGDEVAFLGISYRESVEDGLELVDRTGVEYPIGRDTDGSIGAEFGVPGFPTTVFVAADGTITYSFTRRIPNETLTEQLDRLVA